MVKTSEDIIKPHFDIHHGFKYREIRTDLDVADQLAQVNILTHNAIFFHLEGELRISWDDYKHVVIKPGEFYFLPRGAKVSASILGESICYVVARLDHNLDSRSVFTDLLNRELRDRDFTYQFNPMIIRESLRIFVDSIRRYIIDGMMENQQLQNQKLLEMYFIFAHYYSRGECLNIFYPGLQKNSKFKTFILDNYKVSISIDELVQKAHMSRSTFDRSFKEAFGITPHKWFEMQTRILIMRKASEPNVTVKDMMYEVGIFNPSQFTQLCKRLCGVVPSQLIRHTHIK